MKKATIQISFPAEKAEAVRYYTAEKGGSITTELEEALQKIYERIVPREVRAYLEVKEQAAPVSKPHPPRSTVSVNTAADEPGQSAQHSV